MILFILIFTIGFLIFIELYVGSILFRYDSNNQISFNLLSGLSFLCHPLHSSFLWNWDGLIMNYPFILGLSIIMYGMYGMFKKFDFLRHHNSTTTNGIPKGVDTDPTHPDNQYSVQTIII